MRSETASSIPPTATRRAVTTGIATSLAAPSLLGAVPPSHRDRSATTASSSHEGVIEPDLPIIDALHHLFVRPATQYLLQDYLADIRTGHRIVGSVYMQAGAFLRSGGPSPLRGLGEVEFANGVGAMMASGDMGNEQVCAAIIGHVDLRQGDWVGRFLDEALGRTPERFRGIRQGAIHSDASAVRKIFPDQPQADLLYDKSFRNGLRQIAERGLIFETALFHHQLGDMAALADDFPDMCLVLNHGGIALGLGRREDEKAIVFDEWRTSLRNVASRPNVLCKIGGFGLPFWGFGFDGPAAPAKSEALAAAWAPYVQEIIDAFGCARCMMASNYPPDAVSADFLTLWNALKLCVRDVSRAEKEALFHDTAARTYRLPSSE